MCVCENGKCCMMRLCPLPDAVKLGQSFFDMDKRPGRYLAQPWPVQRYALPP